MHWFAFRDVRLQRRFRMDAFGTVCEPMHGCQHLLGSINVRS